MPGEPRRQGRGDLPSPGHRSTRPGCLGLLGARSSALTSVADQGQSVALRHPYPRLCCTLPQPDLLTPVAREVAARARGCRGRTQRLCHTAVDSEAEELEHMPEVVDAQVGPHRRQPRIEGPSPFRSPAGDARAQERRRATPSHTRALRCRRGYVEGRLFVATAYGFGANRRLCSDRRADAQELLFGGRRPGAREVSSAAACAQSIEAHSLL